MTIKKRLTGIWYALNQNKVSYETKSLCGKSLRTTKGAIRAKPDKDDAWFFYLAHNHDVIYDVGANVGYTAILAMLQKPDRDYVLIDPNPKALAQANINLLENKLGFKAQYYAGFVSDVADSSVKFYTIGAGAAGSIHSDHAQSAASINAHKLVNTVTLDYLYRYYKLAPDLVKIDVEGAETQVMKGAEALARECQCTFFIEMHHVEAIPMVEGAKQMLEWSEKNDYTVWYLKTGVKLLEAETIANRGKCHLLLLPKGVSYPEYLKGVSEYHSLPDLIDQE